MKKLTKGTVPAILLSQKAIDSVNAMELKVADSREITRDDVDPEIYGDETVKNQLKSDQSNLCAYCESVVLHVGPGQIDHYRPIVACVRGKRMHKIKPGYYWLSYNWENLIFTCEKCNKKKKYYFPLQNNPTLGVSKATIGQERPLLLNPYNDDPADHVEFHNYIISHKTDVGRATIEYYDLNRSELVEERRARWSNYKKEILAREGLKKFPTERILLDLVAEFDSNPDYRYSGMIALQKKENVDA